MKALVTVFLVGIVFSVICSAAIIGLLAIMNEERRKQCGNCATYDRTLGVCWWDTQPRDERCSGCVNFDRETDKEEGKEDDHEL